MLNENNLTWIVHFPVYVSEVVDKPANFMDLFSIHWNCILVEIDRNICTRDGSGLFTSLSGSWYEPANMSPLSSKNHFFMEEAQKQTCFMSSIVSRIHFGALAGGGFAILCCVAYRPVLLHSTTSKFKKIKKINCLQLIWQRVSHFIRHAFVSSVHRCIPFFSILRICHPSCLVNSPLLLLSEAKILSTVSFTL